MFTDPSWMNNLYFWHFLIPLITLPAGFFYKKERHIDDALISVDLPTEVTSGAVLNYQNDFLPHELIFRNQSGFIPVDQLGLSGDSGQAFTPEEEKLILKAIKDHTMAIVKL